MALDAGTTSSRCILFNKKGEICSVSQKELTQYFPREGWVEQDAEEIWNVQLETAREAMEKAGAAAKDIAAIGIANQRETTIVWDKKTGKPVCPAIVWQCRRTAAYCDKLKERNLAEMIREKTGLPIDAYFSGTKLHWILEHVGDAKERAKKGELLFGTVETWLIWKLTGGRVHATDYSNASRTMLFHIRDLTWDKDILEELDIPECMLPETVPSGSVYGMTEEGCFGGEIPIAGAIGDQQAALFGQACFEKGEVKNTYGTGCFLLMNTGESPVYSNNGLVTTIAWGMKDKVAYALEGSVFMGGAVVQWLRDEAKLISSAAESEQAANQAEDGGGCYLVPAFTGMGAPYWNPYARGMIVGLTRGTSRAHLVRAGLESIAYQVHDVLKAMEADTGARLGELKADGGASANNFLMQREADILGVPVKRPKNVETTAWGAACLAGLAVDFWSGLRELKESFEEDRVFEPRGEEEDRKRDLEGWKRAVQSALAWAREERSE